MGNELNERIDRNLAAGVLKRAFHDRDFYASSRESSRNQYEVVLYGVVLVSGEELDALERMGLKS